MLYNIYGKFFVFKGGRESALNCLLGGFYLPVQKYLNPAEFKVYRKEGFALQLSRKPEVIL